MAEKTTIRKASGEEVQFDEDKLRRSLRRSGADAAAVDAIVETVESRLYEGMRTRDIYKMAYKMLRNRARPTAARYSLKNALLMLGPSGYPFEILIARLLEQEGYEVGIGLFRSGACISHEIDVLATKNQHVIIGECKFHNSQGLDSDVKVPLYVHSRFRDLLSGFFSGEAYEGREFECWIFTNTRFTEDAEKYGACSGLKLISWNAPNGAALRDWIDRSGLHPLTCLSTLTRHEKSMLLAENVVLARDLLRFPHLLAKVTRLSPERQTRTLEEVRQLCNLNE